MSNDRVINSAWHLHLWLSSPPFDHSPTLSSLKSRSMDHGECEQFCKSQTSQLVHAGGRSGEATAAVNNTSRTVTASLSVDKIINSKCACPDELSIALTCAQGVLHDFVCTMCVCTGAVRAATAAQRGYQRASCIDLSSVTRSIFHNPPLASSGLSHWLFMLRNIICHQRCPCLGRALSHFSRCYCMKRNPPQPEIQLIGWLQTLSIVRCTHK